MKCKRCGWEWKAKKEKPAECPNCKSRYYNQEKIDTSSTVGITQNGFTIL